MYSCTCVNPSIHSHLCQRDEAPHVLPAGDRVRDGEAVQEGYLEDENGPNPAALACVR